MYSRTYQTRKNNQNQTSTPKTNPFLQRSFGEDTPQQSQPAKSPEELDAAYQEAKQRRLNSPEILAYLPGKEPPLNQPQTDIQRQFKENIQAQIIQRNQNEQLNRQSLNHSFPSFQSYSPRAIQAKMTIGAVGDKYEQEADQVASQVVNQINSPTSGNSTGQSVQRQEEEELQAKPEISSLQRQEEEELQAKPEITSLQRQEEEELQAKPEISSLQRQEEEEIQAKPDITSLQRQPEEEEIQTKSTLQRQEAIGGGEASEDLDSAINSARGGGQPLDAELQRSMGQAMGADFSGVKVHTDSRADQLNQSIQAKAFTTGQDLFFRGGEYNPGSRGGQELIAHELTHVVQQNGGAVQRKPSPMQMFQGQQENVIQRAKGGNKKQQKEEDKERRKKQDQVKQNQQKIAYEKKETEDLKNRNKRVEKAQQQQKTQQQRDTELTEKARLVLNDMNRQYSLWDGTRQNRGAWWGSPRPGDTSGAKSVPSGVSIKLQGMVGGNWIFHDSMSAVVSFHRIHPTNGVHFIYHMSPS